MNSRSTITVSSTDLNILTQLALRIPWTRRAGESIELLWEQCENSNEKELIVSLIERIEFINSERLNYLCQNIFEKITLDWQMLSHNTYIVAVSDNQEADGSQQFIQNLKYFFAGTPTWSENNFKNTIGFVHELPSNSNLILVDDFIGTGNTIYRKTNWVLAKIKESGKIDITIKIIAIAGMEFSKPNLDKLLIEYYAPLWLKKGISDFYQNLTLDKNIEVMNKLEGILNPTYNNYKLKKYTFGYKRSEALYALQNYGVPNNVFPLFWWPILANNVYRKTIFKRL